MSMDAHAHPEQVADEPMRLAQEVAAVEQLLQEAVTALYAPLNDLARSQIKKAHPYHCATVVLAAGVNAPDSEALRQQRLYLATALEMLNIALDIHQLLLAGARQEGGQTENPNQHSITGSVILTGDYCFTQAAILAAKTDNIRVVEIFSETLKTVSEGILRHLFAQRQEAALAKRSTTGQNSTTALYNTQIYNTKLTLCEAGVEGTAALIASSPAAVNATKSIVRTLVSHWHRAQPNSELAALSLQLLPSAQQQRWQSILTNN